MNNKFILLCIMASLVVFYSSCSKPTDQGGGVHNYSYENKSGHDINLIIYFGTDNKTINITNNNSFSESVTITLPDLDMVQMKKTIAFCDSARLTFNDNKTIFYKPQQGYNMDIYNRFISSPRSKDGVTTHTFTFTEQDYLTAK